MAGCSVACNNAVLRAALLRRRRQASQTCVRRLRRSALSALFTSCSRPSTNFWTRWASSRSTQSVRPPRTQRWHINPKRKIDRERARNPGISTPAYQPRCSNPGVAILAQYQPWRSSASNPGVVATLTGARRLAGARCDLITNDRSLMQDSDDAFLRCCCNMVVDAGL